LLLVNVNGYIVKFNFDRFASGQTDQFDGPYLSRLGSDAIPALVNALRGEWPTSSKFNVLAKSNLYGSLLGDRFSGLQATVEKDWRNAVISDYRALAALGGLKDIKESTLVPEKYVGDIELSDFYSLNNAVVLPNEIDGNLTIDDFYLTKDTILPDLITGNVAVMGHGNTIPLSLPISRIGGNLTLSGMTIQSFTAMPKSIGGDLDLHEALVLGLLPPGIDLHGKVLVSKNTGSDLAKLQLFIKDAQAKGYRVDVPLDLMPNSPVGGIPPGPCGSDEFPCTLVPAR
jgi:hypothetical protein